MDREPLKRTSEGYQTADGYRLVRLPEPHNSWAVYTSSGVLVSELERGTAGACQAVEAHRHQEETDSEEDRLRADPSGVVRTKNTMGFCNNDLHERCDPLTRNGDKAPERWLYCPCWCHPANELDAPE